MNDHLDDRLADGPRHQRRGPKPPATQSGGAVYGLGFVGALVWYSRQAAQTKDYVTGAMKALVWPAFLVYHAFEVLHHMNAKGLSELD